MKSPHRAIMALRGLLYCAEILIKKILVDSNAEISCNGADIVVRDGLENFPGGMNKVPYLSSLFNCVHKSKCGVEIGPEQKSPWCAQTAASYFFISSEVASAISAPPGTIHFTTPTPPGNTTGHSVADCQSARVKSRSVSGMV